MNLLFNASKNKKLFLALYVLIGLNALWFALKGAMVNLDVSKNILDLRLFYSLDDVMQYFDSIGEEGRNDYRFVTLVVDSLFPILYGTLIILQTAGAVGKFFNKNKMLLMLCLIAPLGLVLFDFLENANTRALLNAYPNISEDMVQQGQFYTQTKWTFGAIAVTTLILFNILGKKRRT